MKRVWIGAGLLAILLALGLLAGEVMERRLAPGMEAMTQAGLSAREGDWNRAEALTAWAKADWEAMTWLTAALTGHQELEEIDDAFAQLSAYAYRDPLAYGAICASVAEALTALSQNHIPSWKNFF